VDFLSFFAGCDTGDDFGTEIQHFANVKNSLMTGCTLDDYFV
jgi:hypothetical protein